jgi:NADH:ubiquinone oxidoreductase subunit 5 (subunit L)/multisubunit Na+/H+ antiporter MnhA subunit
MTAASFLKMGHAAFFGSKKAPSGSELKEAPAAMVWPMVFMAVLCVVFGFGNMIPLRGVIQPIFGDFLHGHDYAGWPHSWLLIGISCGVLLLAVINHIIGVRRTGEGVKAVDHIHYAPGLKQVYDAAEKHYFDPYDLIMWAVRGYALCCNAIDKAINWIYDILLPKTTDGVSRIFQKLNNGQAARYMIWSFCGLAVIVIIYCVTLI